MGEATKAAIGRRIKYHMARLNLNRSRLSDQTSIDPSTISRYINGKRKPTSRHADLLAMLFEISVSELIVGAKASRARLSSDANPKPVRIGDICLQDVFLMIGDHVTPLEVGARYIHQPLVLPQKVRPHFDKLVAVAKAKAADAGQPYWNGPNTRLLRIVEPNSRKLADGKEQRGIVLELGPVSWDEFKALNASMDVDLFTGKQKTIREAYAHRQKLYQNAPDLRWCQLSNLLVVNITPITSDGFGIVLHRGLYGVSGGEGKIGNVDEQIERYLDEAHPHDLTRRINLPAAPDKSFGAGYKPSGIPSPFLAAIRGISEEVSTEVARRASEDYSRVKFLNVIMDLTFFIPHLVGIVELGMSKSEADRLRQEKVGKDHSEGIPEFLRLDLKDKRTSTLVSQVQFWTPPGLSAFISALKFWEAKGKA